MIASLADTLEDSKKNQVVSRSQPLTKRSLVHRSRGLQDAAASELARRRVGVIWMAVIAMASFFSFRLQYNSLVNLIVEAVFESIALFSIWSFRRHIPIGGKKSVSGRLALDKKQFYVVALSIFCAAFPWLYDPIARQLGTGNGTEILLLGSLGWGSVALAVSALTKRTLNQSLVASGFVVMFTTFIAAHASALIFVYLWTAYCLWWLLNNHWSTVQCLTASTVKSASTARQSFLVGSVVIFIAVTAMTWDRIPIVRRLASEIMPTSGGSSGKDSAARSGVGETGDALVAARKHAASFGAVDSDMFLDSEKPSLFDVFSEEFGEPRTKKRVERAQALSQEDAGSEEGKFAETNRASSNDEFSIEREPPKVRKTPDDLHSESLMFWEGETGVRLAAQKYQHFDGEKWVKTKPTTGKKPKRVGLYSVTIGEQVWFKQAARLMQNSISPFVDAPAEALKFTRFRSPEIPSRAGMQLWSIDRITFADFFGYTADDCLFMPKREHVPDYTVVRFVNSRIDLERLESLLANCAPGHSHSESAESCQSEIASLAHLYAGNAPRGFDQVDNVIDGIRRNFKLEREEVKGSESALESFLRERKGSSYLFATAAALMLDHLGYETRLVTGFYTNPRHYSASEGATAILPSDAHTWLEVNCGHSYWIPLEPTPGYRKTRINAGLLYLAKKNWQTLAASAAGFVSFVCFLFWQRARLFFLLCWLAQPILRLLPDRRRLAWLGWMLDMRWRLIGHRRPASVTPRKQLSTNEWGLAQTHQESVNNFLNCVDQIRFGQHTSLSSSQRARVNAVFQVIHKIKFTHDSASLALSNGSSA